MFSFSSLLFAILPLTPEPEHEMAPPFEDNPKNNSSYDATSPRGFSRKSSRFRKLPPLYVARPSQQGLGVENGDRAFLTNGLGRVEPPVRHSKRQRQHQLEETNLADIVSGENDLHSKRNVAFQPEVGSIHGGNKNETKRKSNRQPVGSSVLPPRPPRVIIVGAGIS